MVDKGQNAAAEPSPASPERLGRYELIARIADGGMAEVYLARQLGPMNFQKVVVVKKIHPNLARQKEFIGMLLDEARISALIKHPRVVDIYDLGVSRGTYFIAMEYLAGQPLTQVITRGRVRAPLDVYSTARIIADAAEGLHAAHNLKTLSGRALELVHRDVSPSNIIVLYDGGVKLVDFGVAKARGRITETDANQIKGKVGYVSPEQIMENPSDRRSDVFSLGVVMWEALALRRLFDAESEAGKLKQILDGVPLPPSAHRPEVPYELDKICLRALAVKPEERYQSAGELLSAIESFLRDANFRREGGAIGRFMVETFAAERQAQDALLRRVAEADAARGGRTPVPATTSDTGGDTQETQPTGRTAPRLVPDPDKETTATGDGPVTQETQPTGRRRDEPEIDTGVRTFVQKAGDFSSTRLAEQARAARLAAMPAPVTPTGPPEPTRSTRVLSSAPRPAGPKKIIASITSELTAPETHPPIDPDAIITTVPSRSKPRGKQRTTGRFDLGDPSLPEGGLRQSTGRILPLPPPRAAPPEPASPFDVPGTDEGDGDDDVDITEVDSDAGGKFGDLLGIGLAAPIATPAPPAPQPPSASEAPTEVEEVQELSSFEIIAPAPISRRRRLWIVGGVAVVASCVVAALVVWSLDQAASGADAPAEEKLAVAPIDAAPVVEPSPAVDAARAEAEAAARAAEVEAAARAAEVEKAEAEKAARAEKAAEARARKQSAAAKQPRPKRETAASEPTPAPRPPAGDPGVLYKEGARLYLAGKLGEAQKKYIEALRIAPGYANALRGLGLVYEKSGQKAKAIKALQAYLRMSPRAADAKSVRDRIERLRN
jgi:tRNA A-37 threonylcarbamoyl transferase component Bud32